MMAAKAQIKHQNKILRNIFVVVGLLVLVAAIIMVVFNVINNFSYNGVGFSIVKFCDTKPCLITYNTKLPVKVEGKNAVITDPDNKDADYNIYLRNDPRDLDVEFDGDLTLQENMVFNSEESFICGGKGGIAGANFVLLHQLLGINVIKDENATCDPLGRYTLVLLKEGNETRIEQVGPACYNIYINDCEILEGTERFMLESLIKVNKYYNI